MSLGEFKAAANEVGTWVWGTLSGNFNEKQTIGQVLTDAVISMFPVAGEITAARDVIAVALRMAEKPERREEVQEWVMLILPLLALVPVFGGALKGIGKLLMRVGKNVDEDQKILQSCIWLLNRVGTGNAVRYIKELDLMKYADPVTQGAKEVFSRLATGIDLLKAKFQGVLPASVTTRMDALKWQLEQVNALADRMVPQALKDLNNKLKMVQRLAYQGDWHLIPGAGRAITKETEARLVYDVLRAEERWTLQNAKWPQDSREVFVPREGWPDLATAPNTVLLKDGSSLQVFEKIASFSGPIAPRKLERGTTIYRVVSPQHWSRPEGAFWTTVNVKGITGWYWRVKFAVLQSWSSNGKYVKYVVKDNPLYAWEGRVSGQIDQAKKLRDGSPNPGFGQYLEGGETQLYVDFKHWANEHALLEVWKLPKLETNWTEHLSINIPRQQVTVQKLGTFVEEQKSLASANLVSTANLSSHAAHTTDDR